MFNFFDIESYLPAVSTYASDIDFLILLVAVLVGVPFLIAEFMLVGFVIKFRKKEGTSAQYISGEEASQKRWINYPHILVLIFDVIIIVFAVRVWVDVKMDLPKADHTIEVIGQQWAWNFVEEGPDGKLGTPDDIKTTNELHVRVNKTYHFKLKSTDVLHSFSVPVFRLKQDAIPGREITGWFKATDTGTYDIQCAEMCGIGHGIMSAKIIIADEQTHAEWQQKQATKFAVAPSIAN